MSAYQVSPATIDLMVSAAIELKAYAQLDGGNQQVTPENAQRFGAALWQANIDSVAYRYSGRVDPAGAYSFQRYVDVTPRAALGCAKCFDYQACEVPDYGKTDAHDFVSSLISRIADRLAGGETPWGVEDAQEIAAKAFGQKVFTPTPRRVAGDINAAVARGEAVFLSDIAKAAAPVRPSATVHQFRPIDAAAIAAQTAPAPRAPRAAPKPGADRAQWADRFSIANRPRPDRR